jgi:hypothetical protein
LEWSLTNTKNRGQCSQHLQFLISNFKKTTLRKIEVSLINCIACFWKMIAHCQVEFVWFESSPLLHVQHLKSIDVTYFGVRLQTGYALENGFTDHLHTPLELQVIIAPLLISTIHRSPQHRQSLFPTCCVNSRSLITASNNGDSSASRAQTLLP